MNILVLIATSRALPSHLLAAFDDDLYQCF